MSSHDTNPGTLSLPNNDRAVIEDAKLGRYLLDLDHEDGGPKARFFIMHGYRVDNPDMLRADLLLPGRMHPVTVVQHTPHGMRYTVQGVLVTPTGRTRRIRTVWQVDTGTDLPRLITAYPDD